MPRSPEQQRLNRADRYRQYKQLCEREGIAAQTQRWGAHYAEIRSDGVDHFRRLSKAEHFAYWRERLTPAEIRAIGPCIDFLFREREAVA